MKTWVYSDPHFYHQNICTFLNFDGSKVRPWDDANVMTEEMIAMYNDVVADTDRVYLLGDIAFSKAKFRSAVSRLKGRKVLVPGNHDPVKATALYAELGLDVRGYVVKKGFIMSHIPIHLDCMSRWKLNIHGHLHNNQVMGDTAYGYAPNEPSHLYYNACVERTNFKPKLLDDILKETGLK